MKHWNPDIIGYLQQVGKLQRAWGLAPVLQIVQKIPKNYCPSLYLSIGHVW